MKKAPALFAYFLIILLAVSCGPEPSPVVVEVTKVVHPTPTPIPIQSPTPAPTASATPVMIPDTPTPDPGADDLPAYYGGLVITLDDVGKELRMKPRQGFLLRLGEHFDWVVSLDPPDILTRNQKVTVDPGEQGVFIARKRGRVMLSAVGEPVCLKAEPPCKMPNVLFTMPVVVE